MESIFEQEILNMIEQALVQNDILKIREICKTYQLDYFSEFISRHPCFKS